MLWRGGRVENWKSGQEEDNNRRGARGGLQDGIRDVKGSCPVCSGREEEWRTGAGRLGGQQI